MIKYYKYEYYIVYIQYEFNIKIFGVQIYLKNYNKPLNLNIDWKNLEIS